MRLLFHPPTNSVSFHFRGSRFALDAIGLQIVSADESAARSSRDPPGREQATSMTASQNVSAQALSVVTGALAGAAIGLFLISWLEIGGDFQVR